MEDGEIFGPAFVRAQVGLRTGRQGYPIHIDKELVDPTISIKSAR
jgi:hypothetical protein